jgi:hypothetical protein
MHQTLTATFKGHIDEINVMDNQLHIRGWLVFDQDHDVEYVVTDGASTLATFRTNMSRHDVAYFYSTTERKFIQCGFRTSMPIPSNTKILTIQAQSQGHIWPVFVIDTSQVQWGLAMEAQPEPQSPLILNVPSTPQFLVVDDFYAEPDAVRQFALSQQFTPDLRYHKGNRTSERFIASGTKERFEQLLGTRITGWDEFLYNGVFQYCTAQDALVYHCDVQSYAAAVYLTPHAPPQCGTSFYRSKVLPEVRQVSPHQSDIHSQVFASGFYDRTQLELVDVVGNVYNRLVLWNAQLIHSASEYFGTQADNSRLFHLFFFDIEK